MVGYKLIREECNGWMFLGTEPHEVGNALACELENNKGLSVDECGAIRIESFEVTEEEIEAMPEFQGW